MTGNNYKYILICILLAVTLCTIYSCIITYDNYEYETDDYDNISKIYVEKIEQIEEVGEIKNIPPTNYSDNDDKLPISSSIREKTNNDEFQFQELVTCPACGGIGFKSLDIFTKMDCALCKTTGAVSTKLAQEFYKMVQLHNAMMHHNNITPSLNNETQIDKKICPNCNGRKNCPNCAGRGFKKFDLGTETSIGDCRDCNGSGTCQMCFGKGFVY